MADGLEPGLLQESGKGFNLIFDLKERHPPFFFLSEWQLIWEPLAGITVHLAAIYFIWEWWVGAFGFKLKLLHKPREHYLHYLCRDGTKIEAREGILVMEFQDI